MASQHSSGLLLIIVILLVGLEYSSAKCYKGHLGERKEDESEPKFLLGRKLLQGMKGKSIDVQEINKSAGVDNVSEVPQMESDHIQAQKSEGSMEFVEAADEVANLMTTRDYRGQGKPKRKPPINNHEPHN